MTTEVAAVVILIGLIPATIAYRRGGNFFLWWLGGAALFIVALPLALVMRDERKNLCPFCLEDVWKQALVCPHCHRDISASAIKTGPAQ